MTTVYGYTQGTARARAFFLAYLQAFGKNVEDIDVRAGQLLNSLNRKESVELCRVPEDAEGLIKLSAKYCGMVLESPIKGTVKA